MPLDPKILDDLSARVSELLPPPARNLGEDIEKNIKAALNAAFAKLDLVTREELEIQSAVLQRTRERLVELEQRLQQLEQQNQPATPTAPTTPIAQDH